MPAPVVLHRLDSLEREAILRALRSTGGHRDGAAALLGISRRTLSRRLKLYRALEEADRRDAVRIAGGAHHNGSHDNERELSGKTA